MSTMSELDAATPAEKVKVVIKLLKQSDHSDVKICVDILNSALKDLSKSNETFNNINIQLNGDISKVRLNELITYVDAQLAEDGEGEAWSDDLKCVIYINDEKW